MEAADRTGRRLRLSGHEWGVTIKQAALLAKAPGTTASWSRLQALASSGCSPVLRIALTSAWCLSS